MKRGEIAAGNVTSSRRLWQAKKEKLTTETLIRLQRLRRDENSD